jgi:hypothetical protein
MIAGLTIDLPEPNPGPPTDPDMPIFKRATRRNARARATRPWAMVALVLATMLATAAEHRVGSRVAPAPSHTTVRAVPHTAVHE